MKSISNSTRRIALVIALLLMVVILATCQAANSQTDKDASAKPSNPGGAGPAISLAGDVAKGTAIFAANCVGCHGVNGAGGIPNPGSTDGTVPALNPVDDTMVNADVKTFATNLDLFLEHGSTPSGTSPALSMQAFGDKKTLAAQDIADVLAYIISLNKK